MRRGSLGGGTVILSLFVKPIFFRGLGGHVPLRPLPGSAPAYVTINSVYFHYSK